MNSTTKLHFELVQQNWNSTYLSSVAGAAEYFGLKYSAPSFFVESGYFTAINIQRDLKPCGPYCWNHNPIAKNLESMGICVNWLRSPFDCQSSDYRKHMLEQICDSDAGTVVCMVGLEFQLLCHRDETKLTFTLPWWPDVPTCVHELSFADLLAGDHFPGLAWFTLTPSTVLPSRSRLRNSIGRAVELNEQSKRSEESEYYFGPNAWEQWIAKLESGSYDKHGHWWSSMVWSEARQQAANYFYKEWFGPTEVGKELSTKLADIASLIAKSATQEISDPERAECIRQAQGVNTEIYQRLETCRQFLNAEELNATVPSDA